MRLRGLSQRRYFFGARAHFLYELIGWTFRNATDLRFMNYGYADDAAPLIPLTPEDEGERYCAQLYHTAACQTDLSGKAVLDIGSGRGGGSAHVHRYFAPLLTVGCDLTHAAIGFCQGRYSDIDGLSFQRGNATDLPFEDRTFDVVLNVESAHCYSDRDAFFTEVSRVLKPGGSFLFADFTPLASSPAEDIDNLCNGLGHAGLVVDSHRDITANIVSGLEQDDARRRREIKVWLPLGTRRLACLWAGTRGSWIYRDFAEGRRAYFLLHVTKPPVGTGTAYSAIPERRDTAMREPALVD